MIATTTKRIFGQRLQGAISILRTVVSDHLRLCRTLETITASCQGEETFRRIWPSCQWVFWGAECVWGGLSPEQQLTCDGWIVYDVGRIGFDFGVCSLLTLRSYSLRSTTFLLAHDTTALGHTRVSDSRSPPDRTCVTRDASSSCPVLYLCFLCPQSGGLCESPLVDPTEATLLQSAMQKRSKIRRDQYTDAVWHALSIRRGMVTFCIPNDIVQHPGKQLEHPRAAQITAFEPSARCPPASGTHVPESPGRGARTTPPNLIYTSTLNETHHPPPLFLPRFIFFHAFFSKKQKNYHVPPLRVRTCAVVTPRTHLYL